MKNALAVANLETPLGLIGLAASENGLCRVCLRGDLDACLTDLYQQAEPGPHHPWEVLEQARDELASYLCARQEKFQTPLHLDQGTDFQQSIWKQLGQVGYAKTVSYADLAKRVKRPKAVRAVGNAVGANPLPVFVPCHRVLASNGKLGGFSGGLDRKRKLLAIEGITLG